MAYIPDPTDATQPVDGVGAGTAAAEFRALKGYIAGIYAGSFATFPNRIINGRFAIDQRNAGAAISVNSNAQFLGMDCWFGSGIGAAGVFTMTRVADAVYAGEFRAQLDVTTADAALAVGDLYKFSQRIEGSLIQDLNAGSVNAKTITIAFEIESEITGIFPLSVRNSASDRSYVTTFLVNVANTRETKTITIPLDTAGVWLKDTGIGLDISIGLGIGTTFNAAAANVWSAGNFYSVAGVTNFMGTVNNTMFLRNFRVYQGSADLGVDQRLFPQELALCLRYFEKSYNIGDIPATVTRNGEILLGNVPAWGMINYAVEKRVVPTLTLYNPFNGTPATCRDYTAGTNGAIGTSGTGPGMKGVGVVPAFGAAGDFYGVHYTASAAL